MKVWVYLPRNSDVRVFAEDQFATARFEQDLDNRCTVEDILADGYLEVGGSEEEGYFYIDDGGSIRLVEVE